ncbi:hypothetical protein JYT74_03365 [Crocinitomix catalasitica]|nr:hypothetical protein [Crocinitomix catalasitica]
MASIYITFIDTKSKEVFFIKRIETPPKGLGFRNYWQGAIKRTVDEIGENFKKWRKGKNDLGNVTK